MKRWILTLAGVFAIALHGFVGSLGAQPAKPFTPDDLQHFDKEVRPILQARCWKCHGEEKSRGGLRLDSREATLKGGDSKSVISLEKPHESLLLKALAHEEKPKMPPSGKLPQNEIDALTRWVKAGLPWTTTVAIKDPTAWTYQRVKRPDLPVVKNSSWVRTPIDAFILAKVEAKGLTPAVPADRIALIRRAAYDLTGLPPTPAEVDAFVNDASPNAYEKLLDKLLASPNYGEKWGRHWLDVVRYAETNGYERDGPKPFAWRFRDYVIRAFNNDKPFDRFIKEQLAGDEIDRDDADCVIATGFYRLGLWDDEPADPKQARYDEFDDWVATTAQGFLGMTMNCARCHDHKGDPIPQTDYYRLLSFFRDVQHYSNTRDVRSSFNLSDVSPPDLRATYEEALTKQEARKAELTEAMTKIEDEAIKKMPAEDQRAAEANDRPAVLASKLKEFLTPDQDKEYNRLKTQLEALKKAPEPPRQLALSVNNCLAVPAETTVMLRGSPHAPGPQVEPGFPKSLGFPDPKIPAVTRDARTSGRRSVLANWIASPDNPRTARVFVNRLWQHHMGRGIVPTPNDFGKLGEPATHPELLDFLADEFVQGGWKIKRMHKLIMLSNTYQMSGKANPEGLKLDPANTLWWRSNMRRLTAEEVRDSILSVSGRLNLKAGGASIYPPIPKEVLAGQSRPGEGWPVSPTDEASRRSVYVHIKRSLLVPILNTHDQADTDSSCPVRYTTTVPTQALGMLNGQFANEQATAFADRLEREATGQLETQVRRAIRLTAGRQPSDDEVKRDVAFIEEAKAKGSLSDREALRLYCLLALNTNEFVYLD